MTGGLVLVIGLPNDPVAAPVLASLKQLGAETVHWNPRDLPNDCAFRCQGGAIDGWLLVDEEPVRLGSITGVFNRMSSVELTPEFRALPPEDPLCDHAVRAASALMQWCEITPATVLNRGLANESNSAKAYQAQLIRPFFDIPDTLVTNDPAAARRFAEHHGRVIYKSCSGERSIVAELDPDEIEARTDALLACPVLFQQWVAGDDVRVHVIGAQTIATAVTSGATDYRYDAAARWRPWALSDDHAAACVALAQAMDLGLAGIDLRIAADGRAMCFEVNPSPAFSAYQDATGQPIAEAVAGYLMGSGAV
jgi:hypothetical protein